MKLCCASAGKGWCLDNIPLKRQAYPQDVPGEDFDMDTQCRQQFGPRSRACKIKVFKPLSVLGIVIVLLIVIITGRILLLFAVVNCCVALCMFLYHSF